MERAVYKDILAFTRDCLKSHFQTMLPTLLTITLPNSWSLYTLLSLYRILQPLIDILVDISWNCLPAVTGYNIFIVALNIFHFIFVLKTVFKMFGYGMSGIPSLLFSLRKNPLLKTLAHFHYLKIRKFWNYK